MKDFGGRSEGGCVQMKESVGGNVMTCRETVWARAHNLFKSNL